MATSQAIVRISPLLKPFMKLVWWRSLLSIFSTWLWIGGAIWLQEQILVFWFLPLTWLVIATRQHALSVLIHEATHFSLFRNQILNDLVSDIFLAFPLFVSTFGMRRSHLKHHHHFGTQLDDDFVRTRDPHYQKTDSLHRFCVKSFLFFIGAFAYREFREHAVTMRFNSELPWRVQILRALFFVLILWTLFHFTIIDKFLIYWVVPYVSFFPWILFLRMKAEHLNDKGEFVLRTLHPNRFEKFLVAPFNIGIHAVHHQFAKVPWYQLPSFERMLQSEAPELFAQMNPTTGHLRMLWHDLKRVHSS